jgi:hypothetical protein
MNRNATCCCGACSIVLQGDPSLNGLCHCDNCKRRTGAAFGWSAYFLDTQIISVDGELVEYRVRDEQVRSFCAKCGTTLFWKSKFMPEQTGVAGGAFVVALPAPNLSASNDKHLPWVTLPEGMRQIR